MPGLFLIAPDIFTAKRNRVWDDLKCIPGKDFLNFSLIRLSLMKCLEKFLLTIIVLCAWCVYMCAHVIACMWGSEVSFVELVVSFHLYLSSRDWPWAVKFTRQTLYPLSHLINPEAKKFNLKNYLDAKLPNCCHHIFIQFKSLGTFRKYTLLYSLEAISMRAKYSYKYNRFFWNDW